MTTVTRNQHGLILDAVRRYEHESVPRFCRWIKHVTEVDLASNPRCIITGIFVARGWLTIQVEPTLYLAKTLHGSVPPRNPQYHLIIMDAAGDLRVNADHQLPNNGFPYNLQTLNEVAGLLEEHAEFKRAHTMPYTLSLQFQKDVAHRIAMLPVDQWSTTILLILECLDTRAGCEDITETLENISNAIDIRTTTGMW